MFKYFSLVQGLFYVRRLLQQQNTGVGSPSQGATLTKLLLGMVVYGVLPFDLIPDFIPVIGQLDDAVVIAILLAIGGVVYVRGRRKNTVIKDITPSSPKKITSGQ